MTTTSRIDSIASELARRNSANIARWGEPLGSVPLGNLTQLNHDGRSVRRNHELIDALKKDGRLTVGNDVGVHFAEVQIGLK